MKKVFLDTETSGFTPGQIGQLSMIIESDNNEVTGKNYFFKMDYITQGAEDICGRGLDFYEKESNGKTFKDNAVEIEETLKDSILIAHNLKFDLNFISTEFWRLNVLFQPSGELDTMTFFKPILKLPGKYGNTYKNPKLEEVIDYFSINKDKVLQYTKQLFDTEDTIGFHDARYDTTAMYVVVQIYREIQAGGPKDWNYTFVQQH